MIRLNDLQLVLLSAAAQRDDGSLLPPPEHLADQSARIRRAIPPLIKQELVEEISTDDPAKSWREEDEDRFALVITNAGRARIGVEEGDAKPSSPASEPKTSKIDEVLSLLRRTEGASLNELTAATGWLPHTTRAALTGLRKKGHAIDRRTVEEVSRYFLCVDAAV